MKLKCIKNVHPFKKLPLTIGKTYTGQAASHTWGVMAIYTETKFLVYDNLFRWALYDTECFEPAE